MALDAAEVADLHEEAFAPAMSLADIELYRGKGALTADIAREQAIATDTRKRYGPRSSTASSASWG